MLHTFMCPWKNFACISLLSRGGYSALTWPSIQLTNHAFVSVSISHRNNHKIKVFWQSEKKYILSTCYPLTLPISEFHEPRVDPITTMRESMELCKNNPIHFYLKKFKADLNRHFGREFRKIWWFNIFWLSPNSKNHAYLC